MKRFVLTALILLSLLTWQSYGQTSRPLEPLNKQDWMASNVDLAITKAQLIASRQALIATQQERDNLQKIVDSHLTDSETLSAAQLAELQAQKKQLADLNSTISALESNLASATKAFQDQVTKADKDHKAEVSSMNTRLHMWRGAALTASGAASGAILGKGDLATAGIGAGAGLALDLILEVFGL